jgi:hypothetical protein
MATVDGLTPKQHKALAALLSEPTVTAAAVRVSAAKVIIEYAIRFRELDELESRIAQLENGRPNS